MKVEKVSMYRHLFKALEMKHMTTVYVSSPMAVKSDAHFMINYLSLSVCLSFSLWYNEHLGVT